MTDRWIVRLKKTDESEVIDIFNETKHTKECGCTIFLRYGDITKLEVDAIVNAAHEGLTGGGGVDGVIHKNAGPKLAGECSNLYGCPTGEVRITSGYNLPAKYVIHTVGPVYTKSNNNAEYELRCCYENCLKMAEMQGLKSIAFPCISTGAYCFDKEKAARIALDVIEGFINGKTYLREIYFVCFDDENYQIYKNMLDLV